MASGVVAVPGTTRPAGGVAGLSNGAPTGEPPPSGESGGLAGVSAAGVSLGGASEVAGDGGGHGRRGRGRRPRSSESSRRRTAVPLPRRGPPRSSASSSPTRPRWPRPPGRRPGGCGCRAGSRAQFGDRERVVEGAAVVGGGLRRAEGVVEGRRRAGRRPPPSSGCPRPPGPTGPDRRDGLAGEGQPRRRDRSCRRAGSSAAPEKAASAVGGGVGSGRADEGGDGERNDRKRGRQGAPGRIGGDCACHELPPARRSFLPPLHGLNVALKPAARAAAFVSSTAPGPRTLLHRGEHARPRDAQGLRP